MNIVFRCDSSLKIGTGHVFRCRNLARILRDHKYNIVFVCRSLEGNVIDILEEEFKVITLESDSQINKEIPFEDEYLDWLGTSQENDSKETGDALIKNEIKEIKWLIIDHYALDHIWEKNIFAYFLEINKKNKLQRLVIDDLYNRKHECEILLDQNFTGFQPINKYKELVPEKSRKLLGPIYSILSPDYSALHNITPPRKNIHRILIFFGGSDNFNNTLETIKALEGGKFKSIVIDVVVGSQNKFYKEIKEYISKLKNFYLYSNLKTLSPLIANADFAIGAGGITTWERCCLGLPSLLIPIAKNQDSLISALAKFGLIKVKPSKQSISEWIKKEFDDMRKDINSISSFNKIITDGKGALRVVSSMIGPSRPIVLRDFNENDKNILFHWVNDSDVRKNSITKFYIPYRDHLKWFDNALRSDDIFIFIAEDKDKLPIGQVRFEIVENKVTIDFSLDKSLRGFGLGKEILYESIIKLKKQNKHKNLVLVGKVLKENYKSFQIFKKLGFDFDFDSKNEVFNFFRSLSLFN